MHRGRLVHRATGACLATQDKLGRGRLNELMAKPLALAKELDLPLYCGEWGTWARAPREVELAWHRDMISILAEHNIAYANWAYHSVKSDGELANSDGRRAKLFNRTRPVST